MGHAQKQLFLGREAYPSKTCLICNSPNAVTWLHVLLKYKQQHIHALITKDITKRGMGNTQTRGINPNIKTLHINEC